MKLKRILKATVSAFASIVGTGLCLLSVTSCSTDDADRLPPVQGEDVYINLYIDVPGSKSAQGRALTPDDESAIGNLQVLVFNAVDRFQYKAEVGTLDEAKGTVSVRLRRSSQGESYYLVMLVNAKEVNPSGNADKKEALEKCTFNAVNGGGTPGYPNTAGTRLPMWGESKPQVIGSDTDFGTISFYRAVARVDVGLNFQTSADGTIPAENPTAQGLANFRLQSIQLYNSLDKGYAAPLNGYGNLSIPADVTSHTPVAYSIGSTSPDKSVREIYLAETDNHTDAPNAGDPRVNKEWKKRCCLVVGGKYGATPQEIEAAPVTFYRIDFLADGKRDETLTDIVRNHRYVFNIKSVYAPGYTTPEEAFDNASVNISVNVAHWDQGFNNSFFDKQDHFQCSSLNVSLAYEAGSSAKISVLSNVAAGEWVFENESEWKDVLTVTRPADNETDGYLTFTAKSTGPFSTTVRMKVHNLSVTFIVTQSDGAYLTPGGILVNGWNLPGSGDETDVPVAPDGVVVDPGGGNITVEDFTPGDGPGGEIEVEKTPATNVSDWIEGVLNGNYEVEVDK